MFSAHHFKGSINKIHCFPRRCIMSESEFLNVAFKMLGTHEMVNAVISSL